MAAPAWRFPARLSVSASAGWAPVEQVAVQHRDGDARLSVSRWPLVPGIGIDEVVAGREVVDPPERWTPRPWRAASVLDDPDGRSRTARWVDAEGRRMETTQSYARHRGCVVELTSVCPADDATKAESLAAIAASVSLSHPSDLNRASLPPRPRATGALAEVARTWRNARPRPPDEPTRIFTTEEWFAAAAHLGVAMLPGADITSWDLLDEAQRELSRGVAWRSLEARGASTDESLAEVLRISASHDLLMVVTARQDQTVTTSWYAARPDRMVVVHRGPTPNTVLATAADTADLPGLVIADYAEETEVAVSCVYREDGRVVGDEATWLGTTSPDAVRAALAALLPAAQHDLRDDGETAPIASTTQAPRAESRQ